MDDDPELEEVDLDDQKPATKSDVRRATEELAAVATRVFARAATKDDLDELEKGVDGRLGETDTRLKDLETRMDARFDEVMRHFDVVAENIHQDVAGANKDEISLITEQKIPELERRVDALERPA